MTRSEARRAARFVLAHAADFDALRGTTQSRTVRGESAAARADSRESQHLVRKGNQRCEWFEGIAEVVEVAAADDHALPATQHVRDRFHRIERKEMHFINRDSRVVAAVREKLACMGHAHCAQTTSCVSNDLIRGVARVALWLEHHHASALRARTRNPLHEFRGLAREHRPADHFEAAVSDGFLV